MGLTSTCFPSLGGADRAGEKEGMLADCSFRFAPARGPDAAANTAYSFGSPFPSRWIAERRQRRHHSLSPLSRSRRPLSPGAPAGTARLQQPGPGGDLADKFLSLRFARYRWPLGASPAPLAAAAAWHPRVRRRRGHHPPSHAHDARASRLEAPPGHHRAKAGMGCDELQHTANQPLCQSNQ